MAVIRCTRNKPFHNRVLPVALCLACMVLFSSCRTVSTRGGISYGGKRIDRITDVEPRFEVTNEDTKAALYPEIRYESGKYKVYDLPAGNYLIKVEVDSNAANPFNYPGDMVGQAEFHTGRAAGLSDIELGRIIHLLAPQNNSTKLPVRGGRCKLEAPSISSPVLFRWEPLGDGVDYYYVVFRRSIGSRQQFERVEEGETQKNEVLLSLPPLGEYYLFHLEARRGERFIGILMTQDLCNMDVNYQFRVGKRQ